VSTNLNTLYTLTMPELPGVPAILLDDIITEIVRDFCTQTQCWQEDLTAIDVVADQADYTLTAPANTEIITPTYVKLNDTEIFPGDEEDDDTNTYWLKRDKVTLTLQSTPTAAATGGLEVRVAVRPTAAATSIAGTNGDRMFSEWRRAWASGIKARLMEMPKKGWSNVAQAKYYADHYWEEVCRARSENALERMNKNLQAKAKWTFA
jgi:hypothetical protein